MQACRERGEAKGLHGRPWGAGWGGRGEGAARRGRAGPGERDKAGRKGAKGKSRWKREMTAEARNTKENAREAAKPSGNLL